jgi:hypothetical protein
MALFLVIHHGATRPQLELEARGGAIGDAGSGRRGIWR